jgi:hypothetical protein
MIRPFDRPALPFRLIKTVGMVSLIMHRIDGSIPRSRASVVHNRVTAKMQHLRYADTSTRSAPQS